MKLILVESPTKAKTLTRFLGEPYRVEATMGHVRDLPKTALGVDLEHNFKPSYVIPRDKKKRVEELIVLSKGAEEIILASDPDREGEAIAWHVAEILRQKDNKTVRQKDNKTVRQKDGEVKKVDAVLSSSSEAGLPVLHLQRITFHEITDSAVKDALSHPGTIKTDLVNAQQARRVLDRLVGYKLSPLLWRKLSRKWLSAGRVQSVAVRLIVEREREIEKFTKEPYFTIEGVFQGKKSEAFGAILVSHQGNRYEVVRTVTLFDGTYTVGLSTITTPHQADEITADLRSPFQVSSVEKKEIKRYPLPPYTTSTLQQDAGRRLYFSAKKTMQLAQKLYEEGFITYHRTDSVSLSEKFLQDARSYIKTTHGEKYIPEEVRRYKTKSRVAQEAHEAIRPTDITRAYESLTVGGNINHDHVKLYELIWKRALASQMKEAIFDSTTIQLTSVNAYLFETQGSIILFDGFLKVLGRDNGEVIVPSLAVGEEVVLKEARTVSHETTPPPRYSEAGLVKTLEEKDIGRPSTYAPIISTIIERQYVKKEEKRFFPTELGYLVNDFLVKYFPDIMSLPFTALMEEKLDEIANGKAAYEQVIRAFYEPFARDLSDVTKSAETIKLTVVALDEKCPECGGGLVLRTGRYGKFVACSNFPACKYTRQYGEKIDKVCPKCGGAMMMKRSKRGKMFYGCANYPTCTFAAWKKEDIK